MIEPGTLPLSTSLTSDVVVRKVYRDAALAVIHANPTSDVVELRKLLDMCGLLWPALEVRREQECPKESRSELSLRSVR